MQRLRESKVSKSFRNIFSLIAKVTQTYFFVVTLRPPDAAQPSPHQFISRGSSKTNARIPTKFILRYIQKIFTSGICLSGQRNVKHACMAGAITGKKSDHLLVPGEKKNRFLCFLITMKPVRNIILRKMFVTSPLFAQGFF